jgi:hypothetical protein
VSCLDLLNRFHDFWRDFNTVNRWKFPELSPYSLRKWLDLDLSRVDYVEFKRARMAVGPKAEIVSRKGLARLPTPGFGSIASLSRTSPRNPSRYGLVLGNACRDC